MIIYKRFGDKVTFIILVLTVLIAFTACLYIYAEEYMNLSNYWKNLSKCVSSQDFQCLLEVSTDRYIDRQTLLSIMGANLSVIGVAFGFLGVVIYKGWKS